MKTSTGYPYLKVATDIVEYDWVDISKLTEFQIDTILHNFHIRRDGTGVSKIVILVLRKY